MHSTVSPHPPSPSKSSWKSPRAQPTPWYTSALHSLLRPTIKLPDLRVLVIGVTLLALMMMKWSIAPQATCPPRPTPSPPTIYPVAPTTNVLITGGAGYIGTHMSLLLLQQKEIYNIVIVDDLSRGDIRNVETLKTLVPSDRTLTFIETDIGNEKLMTELMAKHAIDIVIHFAGFAYASESVHEPLKYFDNTVTRTQSLLAAMDKAGIKRLVYSSSSATYGTIQNEQCDLPISEFSPQVPVSPYGLSKLMSEQVIHAYANSKHIAKQPFSYALLRYFNVIGADAEIRIGPLPKKHLAHYGRIVDGCFAAAINNEPMVVYGNDYPTKDGSAIRDYIHVGDLVSAHYKVMQVVHENQMMAYNVGIGQGASCIEVVDACRAATGKDIPITFKERRIGDPPIVLGDAHRIMNELGWVPTYTNLKETVSMAWKWRMKVEQMEKQPATTTQDKKTQK